MVHEQKHVQQVFIRETIGGIVLLGMPGCGKGTQAIEIQNRYNVPEISTGDILRDHVRRGDDLGRAAEPIMKAGELVPDALLNSMVAGRLSAPDCQSGFILDGYPRTVAQSQFLDDMMAGVGRQPPRVLFLDVPTERLVERLTQRWSCVKCGTIYNAHLRPPKIKGRCDIDGAELMHRADDQEATVRHRIETFLHETTPVIDHYKQAGSLYVINADRPPEEIAAEIRGLLEFSKAA